MFKLFKSALPIVGRIPQSRHLATEERLSSGHFFRNERSAEYFRKSQESFQKAQKYLEAKDISNAKAAITEAIDNSRKVELIGPNGFMLNCLKLKEEILALNEEKSMKSASHPG